MSLLNWFSTRKKHDAGLSVLPSSGLSRLESTKPFHAGARHAHQAQPANRKQERLERRELLYAVVRECMVRAGVLSSSYKFKVLSLDPRGRTFLVMVDLAYGGGADTNRLAEIEAMVAQTAKSRYDILVSAVYWRANEHVAVGDVHRPPISRPAPLSAIPHPSDLKMPPVPPVKTKADPLHAEEVRAFRQALDAGLRGEQALAAAGNGNGNGKDTVGNGNGPGKDAAGNGHGPGKDAAGQSYTLLTGFEDTEMSEGTSADLSGTQWGQLR